MASNPPGACCTRGWLLKETSNSGEIIKLADGKTTAYLVNPPADVEKKESAIIYIADVFGIYANSKLVADSYAAQGYTTIIPDIFNNDQLTLNAFGPGFDLMTWIGNGSDGKNPHTSEAIDPVIISSIETLRSRGFKTIGAAGYCFGAKYVVRHYKNGIDVGYSAHPSFVTEEELAAITGPYSISAAEIDEIFPEKLRYKSEEILKKTGLPYQINLFQGVEHGFAVRGNPEVRANRFAKEQAFRQAVAWFDEYLPEPVTKSSL